MASLPSSLKRWGVLALVLALLGGSLAGAVRASHGAGEAAPPAVEPVQEAGQQEEPAGEAVHQEGALEDKAHDGDRDAAGSRKPGENSLDDEERAALLARWDALIQERRRLRAELRQVERELVQVARQLWPYEWERTRERLRERLDQYEEWVGEYGPDIAAWLPPAVVEHIAQRTGRTPEEVRELIEAGRWRELLAPGDHDAAPNDGAGGQADAD